MTKFILSLAVASAFLSCKSQLKKDSVVWNKIVLINSGLNNRMGIANELIKLKEFKPKVVGIDFQFTSMRIPYQDSVLIAALNNCDDLVMISVIDDYNGNQEEYDHLKGSLPEFLENAKIGFANAILEDDEFQTLKRFSCYEKVDGLTIYHFAIRTAMEFDSLKTISFMRNKPRIIDISYKGDEKVFKTFSHDDLLSGKVRPKDIEGKIVLLGYIGPYEGYTGRLANEDKFFSPLNDHLPPHEPDMYGVVYIANIITQVLE